MMIYSNLGIHVKSIFQIASIFEIGMLFFAIEKQLLQEKNSNYIFLWI